MWVWFSMLISIIVVRFLIPDAMGKKKKNLIFLGISYLIIVFFVGSRSPHLSGSVDLFNYYEVYGDAMNNPLSVLKDRYSMENGYLVFNKILAAIVPWNFFIVYFEAAFCTAVMFWYIYRNADSVFLAVMTYICFGPWQFFLTGFRQSFAICFCLIAFELIKKHKTKSDLIALGLIFLATTFHVTAWVFLSVYIIRRIKISKNVLIYCGLLLLFMFTSLDNLLGFGNNLVGREYTDTYRGNVFAGLIPIIAFVGTLILSYLISTWDKSYIEEKQFELMMLVIGLCLYIVRYKLLIIERISFYFTPVISVALTNSVARQRTKKVSNIVYAVCVALCISLFLYRCFTQLNVYYYYWYYLERLRVFW